MNVSVRVARPADVPCIFAMIRELAGSVGEADQVTASEADLLRDGWGDEPKFGCYIAETADDRAIGYVLFSRTYSTWRDSAGIHVEDVYVRNEARGLGIGARLVSALSANFAEARDPSVRLNVYDWNQARKLYERLEFKELKGLLTYQVSGSGLRQLSSRL